MRLAPISVDQLSALPVIYQATIPPEFEDRNGHMNVRRYLQIYDDAGDALYPRLGLTPEYLTANGKGGFDLEHHLWYVSEVLIGETISVRMRFVSRNEKLLHYLMFLVNETRGIVSSVFECIHAHADLTVRRTAPFPAFVVARIDAILAEHERLSWTAPTSGAMAIERARTT